MSRTTSTLGRPVPLNLLALLLDQVRGMLSRPCKQFSFWLECPLSVGHAIALVASGLLLSMSVLTASLPSHPYGWAAVELMLGIELLVPVVRAMKEGGAQ